MTQKIPLIIMFGVLSLAGSSDLVAADKGPAPAAQKEKIVYVPPARGAPKSRVGGGTRGVDPNALIIRLLAPEDVGYSGTDQPVFYWFLSQPADLPLEITLIDDVSAEPVLEIPGNASRLHGIQKTRLSDYGIHLQPDVEYQWSVALVVDPEQRSKDVFATATVKYVPVPEDVKTDLTSAGQLDVPSIYAAGGYWYDAIERISSLIDTRPGEPGLLEQRAALAEQVALPEVAAHDRDLIASP
ncbi:MAG: DUF928 domain-containing protein [Gammaproteobacteria bacterium]|nr:DUF928 domain-containing protein [Gammaproteobacteria bacterium]